MYENRIISIQEITPLMDEISQASIHDRNPLPDLSTKRHFRDISDHFLMQK